MLIYIKVVFFFCTYIMFYIVMRFLSLFACAVTILFMGGARKILWHGLSFMFEI